MGYKEMYLDPRRVFRVSVMIVSATIPPRIPGIAAKVSGHPELSRSAVGRVAYRVAKGMDINDAIALETPETKDHGGRFNFQMDRSEIDGDDANRSLIIRKGLALMMGLDDEAAEVWAGLMKPGRPRKDKVA